MLIIIETQKKNAQRPLFAVLYYTCVKKFPAISREYEFYCSGQNQFEIVPSSKPSLTLLVFTTLIISVELVSHAPWL